MNEWLDRWCTTRRLSQQELSRKWAERLASQRPPRIKAALPIEHTKFILNHGTKAYRRWVDDGCPVELAGELERGVA